MEKAVRGATGQAVRAVTGQQDMEQAARGARAAPVPDLGSQAKRNAPSEMSTRRNPDTFYYCCDSLRISGVF